MQCIHIVNRPHYTHIARNDGLTDAAEGEIIISSTAFVRGRPLHDTLESFDPIHRALRQNFLVVHHSCELCLQCVYIGIAVHSR